MVCNSEAFGCRTHDFFVDAPHLCPFLVERLNVAAIDSEIDAKLTAEARKPRVGFLRAGEHEHATACTIASRAPSEVNELVGRLGHPHNHDQAETVQVETVSAWS